MDTGYEKWKQTIDTALSDSTWDQYDCSIVQYANAFNVHLAPTPGYVSLDWTLIKAMVWTETTGPSNASWSTKPMQIGKPGDPGLQALLGGREGGDLIIPPQYQGTLNLASAIATPQMNICAGIAYLLMRFAKFGFETITSGAVTVYVVKPGDSFDKIAHNNGSTVETLQKLNPGVVVLKPKQSVNIQKATQRKKITGWNPISTTVIAARYNVGDSRYAQKLDYCLEVIKKVSGRTKC